MKFLNLIFGLLPLRVLRIFFLNLIGKNKISYKSKLGIGIYLIKSIQVGNRGKIENFTFLKIDSLVLGEDSTIRRFNFFNGPFSVILNKKCGIGKGNKVFRSNYPVVFGKSVLELKNNTFINSNHFLDLTKSITFDENTVLAGRNSQLWTHGYYHADTGKDRIRIDGEIYIGKNVYIGSRCIFNPGVKVYDAIHIGGGSTISKNLTKSGMFVSQGLRYIENDLEKVKAKLKKVEDFDLAETVYIKE